MVFVRTDTMLLNLVFIIVTLIALGFRHSHGGFPIICSKNITDGVGICCPVPKGFTKPCGGPERGVCGTLPTVNLQYQPQIDPVDRINDDRFDWPRRYVQHGCLCTAQFSGYDCSRCKYGYTGKDCTEKDRTYTRRNAAHYTAHDKKVFVDTFQAAKDTLSDWGVIVPFSNGTYEIVQLTTMDLFQHSHYSVTQSIFETETCRTLTYNFGHKGVGLPTWHRSLLLWVESELRQLSEDKSFTLPYWDWAGASNCGVCTNDFLGNVLPDGNIHPDSIFSKWRTICNQSEPCSCDPRIDAGPLTRILGYNTSLQLPPLSDVQYALRVDNFDVFPYNGSAGNTSFREVLEAGLDTHPPSPGMHNLVHDWVGGTMGHLITAANDPLFLVHHAFVDKLFEMWLRNHTGAFEECYPTSEGPAGHLARDPIVPFYPVKYHIDFFNISSAFGYEYDDLLLVPETGSEATKMSTTTTGWKLEYTVALAVVGSLICITVVVSVIVVKNKKGNNQVDRSRKMQRNEEIDIAVLS